MPSIHEGDGHGEGHPAPESSPVLAIVCVAGGGGVHGMGVQGGVLRDGGWWRGAISCRRTSCHGGVGRLQGEGGPPCKPPASGSTFNHYRRRHYHCHHHQQDQKEQQCHDGVNQRTPLSQPGQIVSGVRFRDSSSTSSRSRSLQIAVDSSTSSHTSSRIIPRLSRPHRGSSAGASSTCGSARALTGGSASRCARLVRGYCEAGCGARERVSMCECMCMCVSVCASVCVRPGPSGCRGWRRRRGGRERRPHRDPPA